MSGSSTILKDCCKLYKVGRGKQLSESIVQIENLPETKRIQDFFGLHEPGSAILSAFFIEMGFRENSVSMERLLEYFGEETGELAEINSLIEELSGLGIVVKKYIRRRLRLSVRKELFVHHRVLDAVLQADPLLLKAPLLPSYLSFLQEIEELIEMKITGDINTDTLLSELTWLCESNQSISILHDLISARISPEEQAIFFSACIQFLKKSLLEVDLDQIVLDLFDESTDQFELRKKGRNGTLSLLTEKYLQRKKDEIRFGNYATLGPNAELLLFENGIQPTKYFTPQICREEHFNFQREEELFFNQSEAEQINQIDEILDESMMKELFEELEASNLGKGITILLHGPSGTGKTALVKKWSRKHQRNLLWVECNRIKSPWVGETEQKISEVFAEYQQACKCYDRKPILLFNEADAILGTRFESIRPAEQMMNSLQNILLQRLEDFEGIFMATTNLPRMLDPAFDRRFLFKINIRKPDHETTARIVKNRFPILLEKQINWICDNLELSGAQYENIERKIKIQEMLNKKKVTSDDIFGIIRDEGRYKYREVRSKIGFITNRNNVKCPTTNQP